MSREQRSERALAAAQAAYAALRAPTAPRTWAWYQHGVVLMGLLKDQQMGALWRSREQLGRFNLHANEFNFQLMDEATRRSGRIVKLTRVLSVLGFRLGMFHLRLARWDAETQAQLQDLYPQLLSENLFTNPARSLYWLWAHIVRPMLPARVRAKTAVLDTVGNPADRARLERRLRRDCTPRFLGGTSPRPWPPTDEPRAPPVGITPFIRYD